MQKKNIRKETILTMSLSETEVKETPTARTESHKNLLTSLKILQLFLFTFFLLFFMVIPDDLKNNIPCILSRFLNFLVEEQFFPSSAFVGMRFEFCVWICLGDSEQRTKKRMKKESFEGFFKREIVMQHIFFLVVEIWVLSPYSSENKKAS